MRTALVLSLAASAGTAQGGADATTETHPDVLERIAFGSCAFEYRPQPIWRAIREQDPQLVLKDLPFDPLEYIEHLDELPFDPAADPSIGQ